MKKIWRTIKNLWYGLFWGLKTTDDNVFSQSGIATPAGMNIVQEKHTNRVSEALLAGKETQQVQELRYRTYKVERESKNFEYYSPFLAVKREEKQDSKFVSYENEDNYDIITIQNNFPIVATISESLEDFDKAIKKQNYWLKIEREEGFLPRYKIEEYTKRLVVKRTETANIAILDFYVSIYPDDKDFKSKGFVKEVEKVKNDHLRSDMLDIKTVSFMTSHAYNAVDMLLYDFDVKNYVTTLEFDGHYILRYKADIIIDGQDMTDKYYCESMAKKYENKVEKEIEFDMNTAMTNKSYVCEECGKVVDFSEIDVDMMEYELPDDAFDIDNENNKTQQDKVSEFLDLEITGRTFGKKLCKQCLKKYLKTLSKQ